MNIIADLHTHTLVSNHAFNTMTEMATQAKKLGLYAIAITDHGCEMPDSPHPWYFYSLSELPHRMEGVWVLKGMEANVMDTAGKLDFSAVEFKHFDLDWVTTSIHNDLIPRVLTKKEATKLWLNICENPLVDMIGHSESPRYAYDIDVVTKAFAKNNKIVEINANSPIIRSEGNANMREIALACKRNGTKIAINSDAHSIYTLGRINTVTPMLEEIEFPEELIINSSTEKFIHELQLRGKKIAEEMQNALLNTP